MQTFVGDIINFRMLSGITLTGYTLYIKYRKPNGVEGYWNALIDGSDSTIAYYITSQTDLDMSGIWSLQIYAEDAGVRGHGEIARVTVEEPLSNLTTAAPTTAAP